MSEAEKVRLDYEKIFGKDVRENIFSDDDEEYQILRQSILNAERIGKSHRILPFTGINISLSKELLLCKNAREAEKEGLRVFYICRYKGKKLVVNAAGYYDIETTCFVILRDSFFRENAYFYELVNRLDLFQRQDIFDNVEKEGDVLSLKGDISYPSASIAASYLLGYKTSFREWKNEHGSHLDDYFARFRLTNIDYYEDRTFPD
jgi:hypothetical protein